jgi:integrase
MSRNKKTSESLFQFMNLLIALLLKNGQYRTSLHYKASLNSFKRYRDNKDIALKEIDAEVMRSYEAYLHHTAEVCKNTSSFYLRILRATYNKAVAKGLTPQQHPFSDVYTGIAQTRKRAIPTENVSQIKSLQSVKDLNPKEEMTRETGQRLTIRWEKEMQELLEKYQAQTASSSYLFPFLVDDGNKRQDKTIDKKQDEARLYHNAEARISYHLRKFGATIGIKGKLTLYVARHSWATTARDNHISISVISEALGHHSETTTQIYLRSIKSSEVDDANAKILAAL